MNKKLFSGIAAVAIGTLGVSGLLLKPAIAFADEHHAAGEKSCSGKGEKSCGAKGASGHTGHTGEKSCSKGEKSCSKGEKSCSKK